MKKTETKTNDSESKIAVIEQALLKNVIGGQGGVGEISARIGRVECTGK